MTGILFILLGLFVFSLLISWLWYRASEKAIKEIAARTIRDLKENYPDVFQGDYTLYTDGHPYVWVDSSLSELHELVEASARGLRGMALDPARYSCKCDVENRRFYFVAREISFNFNSLVHYEEYVPKDKQYSVRVRSH